MINTRTTKTRIFAAATALIALAALAGCSTATPAAKPSTKASGLSATFVPATSGKLHIYNWADYMSKDVLAKFTKETGIVVTVDSYQSNEELEAKLQQTSGTGYDLIVPNDYMVQILAHEGLLKKIDTTGLPNGKNIEPSFENPYFDKGRQYSSPNLYGTTGIMYDSAKVAAKDAPKSWKDYFSAPAVNGRVDVFDDPTEVINDALRAVGGKSCSQDNAKLQAAQELLTKFKNNVGTISSSGTIDRLTSGQTTVGMVYSGGYVRGVSKVKTMKFVYPSDGITLWQDNFAIPSGAENVQQALTFMNFMLDPKNMAMSANAFGYNSGVTGVTALLSPELKTNPAVVVPATDQKLLQAVPPCDNATLNKYTQIWTAFKA
jgi:spermidine/putrescine transport system substrate-binding protein